MRPPVFDSSGAVDPSTSGFKRLPFAAAWGHRVAKAVRSRLLAFDRDQLPFAHFEDCNKGTERQRKAAFAKNKEYKNLILPYIGVWGLRGLVMCVALLTADNAQGLGLDTSLLQAVLGVGFAGCLTVCVVMSVAWMGLTCMHD